MERLNTNPGMHTEGEYTYIHYIHIKRSDRSIHIILKMSSQPLLPCQWTPCRSKLENILFTKELQQRADAAGKKITAVALHPGAVRTDLPRYIIGDDKFVSMQDGTAPSAVDVAKTLPLFYFTKNVLRGASTQIFLSADQGKDADVKGKFFFNMQDQQLQPAGLDMEKAKGLWKVSEDMSGIKFNL